MGVLRLCMQMQDPSRRCRILHEDSEILPADAGQWTQIFSMGVLQICMQMSKFCIQNSKIVVLNDII